MSRHIAVAAASLAAAVLAGVPAFAVAAAPIAHPVVTGATVWIDANGTATAIVDVRVGDLEGRPALRLDRGRATYTGEVTLAVGGRTASARTALLRIAPGTSYVLHQRVRLPRGLAHAGRRLRMRITVRVRLDLDGRGALDASPATAPTLVLTPRRIAVLPLPERPRCETLPGAVSYGRPVDLRITCLGAGTEVYLLRGPQHGRARVIASGGATLTLRYTPAARRVGTDGLRVSAVNAGGTTAFDLDLDVRPFRLRALGDSVSAGYGFLANGTPMTFAQFATGCIPTTPSNNRCSSNSPNGPGSTGPVGWSPDFGLRNNVAWSAQFANAKGLTGSGQFENWAVTGSVPADWDTGGSLNDILQGIVDDDPDLTVMTLGANPLLDEFLFGSGLTCAFTLTDAQLRACVQRVITSVRLVPRLRSVIGQLLAAPANRVIVSRYHLAVPASTVFSPHSIGILFDTFNANIAQAVTGVSGYGTRVFLMDPPRFDVGRAPGTTVCPGKSFVVDGPSHQSQATQDELALNPFYDFCPSSDPWIISADTGIHPNVHGHAQFAAALAAVVAAHGLLPPLPASAR